MGAKIALVGRNIERLNGVADQIKNESSSQPLIIVADITKDADRIMNQTVQHFGKLDILINSAGTYAKDSIENVNLSNYDDMMNVDVRSVIQLIKLAVPHLEETKGNILNVSGAAGLRILPNTLSYCIAKGALNQLTKCAALDLAAKGIRVNAINPVAIRTPLLQNLGFSTNEMDELFIKYGNIYPIGRVGEVSDTSTAIEFLTSDSASFFTGILLPVDGGSLIGSKPSKQN